MNAILLLSLLTSLEDKIVFQYETDISVTVLDQLKPTAASIYGSMRQYTAVYTAVIICQYRV